MSDSVRPQRWQPTRLHLPWDSPGKNTGVGCQFLLQCMKVKSESEVTQSCPTLSEPLDCRLPGSSVHGILLARVLELGVIGFSETSNDGLWSKKLYVACMKPYYWQLKKKKKKRIKNYDCSIYLWKIMNDLITKIPVGPTLNEKRKVRKERNNNSQRAVCSKNVQ